MEILVLHHNHRDNSFNHVATVDATCEISNAQDHAEAVNWALEYAYRLTQNIEGSWSRERVLEIDGELIENPDWNKHVTTVMPLEIYNGEEYGHRSSMMGDRMIIDGKTFEVDFFGFKGLCD